MSGRAYILALAALSGGCLLSHAVTSAAGRLDIAVGSIDGAGWRAAGVTVGLEVGPPGSVGAVVTAATAELPEPVGAIEDLRAECPSVEFEGSVVRCRNLRLSAGGEALPSVTGEATFDRRDRSVSWDLVVDGGLVTSGQSRPEGWRAGIRAKHWPLSSLAAWLPQAPLSGDLTGSVTIAGRGANFERADFDTTLSGFQASSEDGTMAVESLELSASGHVLPDGDTVRFEARLAAGRGESYLEPVYINLAEHPVTLSLDGRWDGRVLELGAEEFAQAGVARGRGRVWLEAVGEGWQVSAGLLDVDEAVFPGVYTVVLRPFLVDTDLGDLETRGRLAARARLAAGRMRYIQVSLDDVDLDDRAQRLAIYGLEGELSWAPRAADVPTRPASLAWSGGFLYGIPFGASWLDFEAGPGGWALKAPARIPVLDGALAVRTLAVGDFTEGNARVKFDAELEPVGMRAVSRALNWPPMSGTLSGRLPELTYENGNLGLGGALEARVFGGRARVSDLRIHDPFNAGSRLEAELKLEGLDLEQLTEAFSFGLITGTLDGYVQGLQMIDWRPVLFDARFYTPDGDPRPHRISQRAVDNIASLGGGGGAAALSRGFLRFFDEFGYGRLALGCRLEDEVCRMSGVKPAETGYYILTGSGLPRIEVIGFADRVNWPSLVGQLQAIVESEGPVVR